MLTVPMQLGLGLPLDPLEPLTFLTSEEWWKLVFGNIYGDICMIFFFILLVENLYHYSVTGNLRDFSLELQFIITM